MKNFILLFFGVCTIGIIACTDLNEDLNSNIPGEIASEFINSNTDVDALLRATEDGLDLPIQDQSRFWAASQHTSDETIGPTRGPDWDDNGVWRVLHDHTWSADHVFLTNTFNELLQVVFAATNTLSFNPEATVAAQAEFLRAYAIFNVVDGWNQVPFREPGSDLLADPDVLSGGDAVDRVISDLEGAIASLPDGPPNTPNKDAARVLLMKAFLNKGTFADRTNPSFPAEDMTQVISLADQIINSGRYNLEGNFFGNFARDNDQISTENIWTLENEGGVRSGNARSRYFCTLHYNQNPSGWNGFTTLGDFYDKFEDSDIRRGAEYPGVTDRTGLRVGLLEGQQFDADGNALQDRLGNPLSFTKEISLVESGANLEVTGVRVVKYPPDYDSGDNIDNDYVIFRYADVLLMRAEALLRTGDSAGALEMVNSLRSARGASALASLSEAELLDERGRELYWEGFRRQDMIRFGTFLDAYEQKPASGEERLLFPIPANVLATNPNIVQNPGY